VKETEIVESLADHQKKKIHEEEAYLQQSKAYEGLNALEDRTEAWNVHLALIVAAWCFFKTE
jgi:hypothetical protein